MISSLDTGQVHSYLGSKEQLEVLGNGGGSLQNMDIECSIVNIGLNDTRILLSLDEQLVPSSLTFENHDDNSAERVKYCKSSPGFAKSFVFRDDPYNREDARQSSKSSFFPLMEADPLIWVPPEPEDMEDVINSGANNHNDEDYDDYRYSYKEERQKMMIDAKNGQLKILASRCLATNGISYSDHDDGESWLNIVTSLSWEAALLVKPDAGKGRDMDPRSYIKVKCIASGSPSQSEVINGLVFKKSPTHKHMPTRFRNAKLLLLKGCLGKSANELSSIASMGKEKDHLNSIVDMIKTSHPNVVLVEERVSRDIQEALFAKGIAVVFDMKLAHLERIALCTGSQIVPLGDCAVRSNLKHCDSFHFEKFVEEHNSIWEAGKSPSKTLMFLEGCPRPLGCTILLKGANSDELMKIKHALHHMILKAYHLKLEISYFADQRTFLSDINSLRELNDMSADEMVTSIDSYASPNYNSLGRKASLACLPLAYAVDIHISDGDGSAMKSINGGQCNSSERAEGSLILLGSSRHQHVSKNSDRILEECLPDLTSESISSPFGSKENEDDNDGSANLSPLVETFDYKKQLSDIVHENQVSEFHIDRKDGHFSDLTEVTEIQIDENTNEVKLQNNDDVGSLLDSESILVLISSQCITKQVTCEESHLSRIKYYGDFDVSLGRYLQDILLSQEYTCSSCGEPSEAHIYRYTHRNGILAAIVSQLPRKSVLPGEAEGKIWMWTQCLKCEHNKGFPKASRRVVMSFVACRFSFGKFLDLSFANHSAANRLSRCGHFLHKDCLRFFGLGSKVAMFRYSPLVIYTACKPPLSLEFYNQNGQVWMMKEAKDVLAKGELLFEEVANVLRKLKSYFASWIKKRSINFSCPMKQISEIESMLERDKAAFEASLLPAVQQGKNVNKIPDLNWLIKELRFMIYLWDRRLHFLLQCVGKFSSDILGVDSLQSIIGVVSVNNFAGGNVRGQGEITEEPLMRVPIIVGKALLADGNTHTGDHEISEKKLKVEQVQFSEEIIPTSSNSYISVGGNFLGDTSPELSQDVPSIQGNLHFKYFEEESVPILDHVQEDDSHHVSIEPLSNAEEAKESERRSCESCKSNENPIMFQSPHNPHSDSPEQWIWAPFSELRKEYMKDLHDGSLHKFQFIDIYSPLHLSRVDKIIPRECSLHFLVGSSGSVVSLLENDISSIIACALASYQDQHGPVDSINEKEEIGKLDRAIDISNCLSTESLKSEGAHSLSPDELGVSFFVDELIASDNSHPKITLGPRRTAGKSKHSVICIYAKEFRSLRKNCFLSELAYITSLSRCNKWDAQGGKSKVFFAKTMDERFIIKQMKKTELDSFLKFGPQYFNYLSSSLASGSQTCIAKILGIYQVAQVRNGKEVKTDLMVMENLLFGRNISCKYDLKGVAFSRYVSDGNGPNVVLLDENFIEDMRISPIYVGGRSKRLLERAIWNDTSFLTLINVMDYSLLVGVDRDCRELVFGIIDYVRQYTWDKKLETWVKSSLVVPKNALPTVVSPKEYKKRFRKFLCKYILMVPDAWSYVDRECRELVFGIIDYVRQYTWDKKLETWVKSSLVVPKNALPTVVSPKEYKKRFRKFLCKYILMVPDAWSYG